MKFIDKDLYHTRGDSGVFTVSFVDDEENPQITLEDGDKLIFTVKNNTSTQANLLQKIIEITEDTSEVEFKIKPEDTKKLDYGKYYYDVQILSKNGDVLTVSKGDDEKAGRFILTDEVTYEN